jgi:hypothetical protein
MGDFLHSLRHIEADWHWLRVAPDPSYLEQVSSYAGTH